MKTRTRDPVLPCNPEKVQMLKCDFVYRFFLPLQMFKYDLFSSNIKKFKKSWCWIMEALWWNKGTAILILRSQICDWLSLKINQIGRKQTKCSQLKSHFHFHSGITFTVGSQGSQFRTNPLFSVTLNSRVIFGIIEWVTFLWGTTPCQTGSEGQTGIQIKRSLWLFSDMDLSFSSFSQEQNFLSAFL